MADDADAIDQHRRSVIALSKPGQALAPNAPHATVNNRSWFVWRDGKPWPMPKRAQLHRRLLAEQLAEHPNTRQSSKAIVLAGPPGAGKSTALATVLGDHADEYLVIDADEFKRALLTEAVNDGSYHSALIPEEVTALERSGQRFFPMEMASLVHEESSILAKQQRNQAIERGDNIVVDTVLSSENGALQLGAQLEAAGYTVEVIDVEVPYEISQQRIAQRWEQSYAQALTREAGLGGRWVPSEYAREVFDGRDGKSRPEAAAERLAAECGAVNRFRRYRTELDPTGAVTGPKLELDLVREAKDKPLVPATETLDAKARAARDFAKAQFRPARAPQKQPPRLQPGRNPLGRPGRTQGPSVER